MKTPITLRYPNGRTHEADIATTAPLRPGVEFELYGRRWRALERAVPSRRRPYTPRVLCECTQALVSTLPAS